MKFTLCVYQFHSYINDLLLHNNAANKICLIELIINILKERSNDFLSQV